MEDLILSEINVKALEYIKDDGVFVKSIKPNFKALGPKVGKNMKVLAGKVAQFGQVEIQQLESQGSISLDLNGESFDLIKDDVEISTKDIPGWSVAVKGNLTVALDISLSEALLKEGNARELINRVQNIRKEANFELTDKILLQIVDNTHMKDAVNEFSEYICREILATQIDWVSSLEEGVDIDINDQKLRILVRQKG